MILEILIKPLSTLQCIFVVHCGHRSHLGFCADRGFVVVYSGDNNDDVDDDYDNNSDDDFVLKNG